MSEQYPQGREAYIDTSKPHVTGNIEWLYVHKHTPPRGRKLHILTRGRVSIQGPWEDGMGYVAWQHMFKRNKQEEAEVEAFLKGQ